MTWLMDWHGGSGGRAHIGSATQAESPEADEAERLRSEQALLEVAQFKAWPTLTTRKG